MISKLINKKVFFFVFLGFLLIVFLYPFFVLAQVDAGLEYAAETGLSDTDPRIVVARVIRIFMGFLGIIAIGLIMYAGWLWMTSEGNEEKISQAKAILKNAIIGLIIIVSAFAIVSFILGRLTSLGKGTGAGGGPGSLGGRGFVALGNGIIDSHYPTRDQKDLPRNTKISLTFKESIDATTIIKDGKINTDNIIIYRTVDGSDGPFVTDVVANKTDDNKIFVFKPAQYLGSPSEKIWYTVALSSGIRKANGQDAFPGSAGTAYDWSFEVGTFVDLTPPKVESVIPLPGDTEPRNVVVQINFDEAVDPIAVSGRTADGFENIAVNKVGAGIVNGNFYISNQYKTVEFLTEDSCGTNSCGETIYCLPGNSNLSVLAKSSELEIPGESGSVFPYNGVVDMADNSLDGNSNSLAEGPEAQSAKAPYNANNPDVASQGDDYTWSFKTSDKIDSSPPVIATIYPRFGEGGIGIDTVPQATFGKFLMSSAINTISVKLLGDELINYWVDKINNSEAKETTINIRHDQFLENLSYSPVVGSGIKDIYQNCYTPCSGAGKTGAPSCCDGAPSANSVCY